MTTHTNEPVGRHADRAEELGDQAPPVSEPRMGWALVVLAVVVIVAAVLPWASQHGSSVKGTSGDGEITILCAVVVGVAGLAIALRYGRRPVAVLATVFAALITLVGIVDVVHGNRITGGSSGVSLGIGLWLTLVAGVVAVLVALAAVAVRRQVGPGRFR